MPSIYLKPGVDPVTNKPYRVRLPQRPLEHLPAEGARVEQSSYWVRRLRDGSVVRAEPPKRKAAKSTSKE